IDFESERTFDELTAEFSRRYLGGLRFIPADRRDARDFTRAEFVEYPLFNHDLDLVWDDDYRHFRISFDESVTERWFTDPAAPLGWQHGSLERCLGVLLRQIPGVHGIRINPNN